MKITANSFCMEELAIIAQTDCKTKEDAVKSISSILPYIDDEFTAAMHRECVTKLLQLPDEEFAKLDFSHIHDFE